MIDRVVVVGGTILGTAIGTAVEPTTHVIDMGTIIAVTGIVFPGVWWLSRTLTKLSDRLESVEQRIGELPCQPNHPARPKQNCLDKSDDS